MIFWWVFWVHSLNKTVWVFFGIMLPSCLFPEQLQFTALPSVNHCIGCSQYIIIVFQAVTG